MANVIPQQIYIRNGQLHVEDAEDTKVSSAYIRTLLSRNLGNSFEPIHYLKGASTVFGHYHTTSNEHIYFQVANLTFMGGLEGQHPRDLKRIQYDLSWRDFYNEYSQYGKVIWLGLYSYKGMNVWAFF